LGVAMVSILVRLNDLGCQVLIFGYELSLAASLVSDRGLR
jgi:hypothetical protein